MDVKQAIDEITATLPNPETYDVIDGLKSLVKSIAQGAPENMARLLVEGVSPREAAIGLGEGTFLLGLVIGAGLQERGINFHSEISRENSQK